MWWWEYVIITGLLLFGLYVFVMGTGYLTMILSHASNPTAERKDVEGTRSRDVAAIHPDAASTTAAHHSDRPADRAA